MPGGSSCRPSRAAVRQGASRLFGADGLFGSRRGAAAAEASGQLTPRSAAHDSSRPPQGLLEAAAMPFEETAQALFGGWSARSVIGISR